MTDTEPLDLDAIENGLNLFAPPVRMISDTRALIAEVRRLRAGKVSPERLHEWFTSHSSAAVARVIADGQSVIDERMADGVFE